MTTNADTQAGGVEAVAWRYWLPNAGEWAVSLNRAEIAELAAEFPNWRIEALVALAASPAAPAPHPAGHVEIAHDGFAGDIIGHYETREGKRGVVVQQDGTRVVHVYGEKWIAAPDAKGER